jgi:hypothetical protein
MVPRRRCKIWRDQFYPPQLVDRKRVFTESQFEKKCTTRLGPATIGGAQTEEKCQFRVPRIEFESDPSMKKPRQQAERGLDVIVIRRVPVMSISLRLLKSVT